MPKKKEPPKQVLVLADSLDAMADNIVAISEAAREFKLTRLKEKTLLLLLKNMTGLSMNDIKRVLDALPLLEKEYLK